jgi:bla regulator protein BlaR1
MTARVCIALTVCASAAIGQSTAGPNAAPSVKPLTFEVVSIRPSNPDSKPSFGPTPDGFRMVNHPLIGLFQLAYVPIAAGDSGFFRGSRISGAPDWLSRTDRFDVVAKVSEADMAEWQNPASQPQMLRAMMRALLEERLNAVAHIENKELPVFDLVVAKNGPKFKPAETLDSAELRTKHPGSITSPDGSLVAPGGGMRQMNFFAASLVTLTPILSYLSGRPVEDKTGLQERYDFSIQMNFNLLGPAIDNAMAKAGSPVDVLPAPPPPPGMDGGSSAPPMDSETSIFSAVQEQLGLRLEPAKGQVETLVIDHVERPTQN